MAAQQGHKEMVEFLLMSPLELGGLESDALANDNDGATPLHLAAAKGHVDVCNLLVSPKGGGSLAAVARDKQGRSAMDYAKTYEQTKVFRIFQPWAKELSKIVTPPPSETVTAPPAINLEKANKKREKEEKKVKKQKSSSQKSIQNMTYLELVERLTWRAW